MTKMPEKRFCKGNIGESVKVKIPDIDRSLMCSWHDYVK